MKEIKQILGFQPPYAFMSNFTAARVILDGIVYPTVEHAYQAAKTHDQEERRKIRLAVSPGIAKRLGRKLTLREDWEEVKDSVMLDLLIQKFSIDHYREMLLATEDAYLEETNHWGDTYWGVCQGVGENRLGCQLMQIREYLSEQVEGRAQGA